MEHNQFTCTEFAYEAVASLGYDTTFRKASPVLIETIMIVDVMTPSDFIDDTIANLNARGGIVISHESRLTIDHIHAELPLRKHVRLLDLASFHEPGGGRPSRWNSDTSRRSREGL